MGAASSPKTESREGKTPAVAVTEPLPAVEELAVKVVEGPEVGVSVPAAVVDQVTLATLTGFPYASEALALKLCVPARATVAERGETLMLASAAAMTAWVWAALP